MWCTKAQRKVHFGYWIAQTCHAIAIRTSRHLNTYHILGALFEKCMEMSLEGRIPRMTYCPNPEQFDTKFLTNVGILERRGGKLRFYKVTYPESQLGKVAEVEKEKENRTQTEAASPTTHALIEATTPEMHARPTKQTEGWRIRMEGLLERLA